VSGGTLEVINSSDSNSMFTISGGGINPDVEFSPGALVYQSDRGTEVITLENGAVMTRQEGATGSAMLAEPRWFYDGPTKTLVVYLMKITADERMAKSGMATVRMSLASTNPQVYNPTDQTVVVRYNEDADNKLSTAWKNYLTSSTVGMSGPSAPDYTYTLSGVKKLVIKEYDIKILGI